nr:MAG TPA: hypothetical protein [Bacteriophage sp.]
MNPLNLLSFFTSTKGLAIIALIFAATVGYFEIQLYSSNKTIFTLTKKVEAQADVISKYELSEALVKSNLKNCNLQIDKITSELEALKIKPKEVIKTVEKVKKVVEKVKEPINESNKEKAEFYENLFEEMGNVR